MSSICKKKKQLKKATKGRNSSCDQRNKIICIYCHGSSPLEPNKMWHVSRKTNSASQHTALFVSAAFIGICQANSLKSCLSVIAFMPDCGNSLPYLKGSFQQEPVSRPARCTSCGSSLQLYAQTWVVTLHFWSFSSSHSHCFKHCDAVTEQWFYLGLTGPVVSLSGLRTPPPPFLPWLSLALIVYVKHKHIHVMPYLPLAGPAQSFTVDSQVLVQSSWQEPASIFPPRRTS